LKVLPKHRDIHPFGCPAYALDGDIQSGIRAPKWGIRARLAIYIGSSPDHARSVSNLLSLTTGLVSPQYHVRHDDTFQTVQSGPIIRSLWQHISGLTKGLFKKQRKQRGNIVTQIPIATNNTIDREITNDAEQKTVEQTDEVENEVPAVDDHSENEGDNTNHVVHDEDDESVATEETALDHPRITRSGRLSRFPQRYDDYIALLCENKVIEEEN
jgi:hypothetical protein